jgi:proliferating cell nuclear antigen
MKLIIGNKKKAQIFTAIFQNLNRFTVDVNIYFKEEELYIQGMDSGHCSMFEIVLKKDWFEDYTCDKQCFVGVNAIILYKIFNTKQENQIIILEYTDESDKLDICFKNLQPVENEFSKEFCVPLMDIDSELLQVPEVDYDIFININTKSFTTMVSQLEIFNDVVDLDYNNEELSLKGNGDNGKIRIVLKDSKNNNLNKCEIKNVDNLKLSYSIKYISDFCSFSKINSKVNIMFRDSMPMVVHYELEESENSYVKFYLAPKIDDN